LANSIQNPCFYGENLKNPPPAPPAPKDPWEELLP